MTVCAPSLSWLRFLLLWRRRRQFYYVYGFVLLVFSILVVVTVCVSIVITYFILNAEVRVRACAPARAESRGVWGLACAKVRARV